MKIFCTYNAYDTISTGLSTSFYLNKSTLEARKWGFHKHAQAQPKKGVAYKKKMCSTNYMSRQ